MKIKAIALSVGLAFAAAVSFVPLSITDSNASSARGLFDSYNNSLGSHTVDGRSGRTWSGGQISARWNRPQIDIIDIQPPSISVGCGGVDIFAGAFGMISGDELSQIGRAIAQGASVYFFKLAINSICSSCAAEMENIANALRRFNELSRNACENTEGFLADSFGTGEGSTLEARLKLSGSIEQASGSINSWTDRLLNPKQEPTDPDAFGEKATGSFPGTALKRANVDVSLFDWFGFYGDSPRRIATSVLMTFIGGFSIDVEDPTDADSEPGAKLSSFMPASLNNFFIAPSKEGNLVDIVTCRLPENVDRECINFGPETEDPIEYESVYNVVRQYLAGTKDEPNTGIVPRVMMRQPLSPQQRQFAIDFRIPVQNYLRLAEEYNISVDTIVDYLAIQTTISITHQIDAAIRSLYSAVQNDMPNLLDGPTFMKENNDAYIAYINNMAGVHRELESHRAVLEGQMGNFLKVAQLVQSRSQGR